MLNQCQFIGNLGADPEIKSFSSGDRICNMRLAVTHKWTDRASGERKERTEWVSVVLRSEGLIGIAEKHLRKGKKVFIQGELRTRRWQDQSGQDRYSTEVVLSGPGAVMTMLDGGGGGSGDGERHSAGNGGSGNASRGRQQGGFNDDLDDDEIPFISSDPRYDRRAR